MFSSPSYFHNCTTTLPSNQSSSPVISFKLSPMEGHPHCLSSTITTLLLLLSAISVPNPVFGTATCDFPAIFNFGDSNSDTGGLSAAFGQVGPPHGESYFHHPAGRYCDGRLVVDFIGTVYKSSFFLYSLPFSLARKNHLLGRRKNRILSKAPFFPF